MSEPTNLQTPSERISRLTPVQRELLLRKLLEKRNSHTPFSLKRHESSELPPLSCAQQRLWILDRLNPGQSSYHFGVEISLHGDLDCAALVWSIQEIIRRHEPLRMTVGTNLEGEPAQILSDSLAFELKLNDLSKEPEAEIRAHLLIEESVKKPFDLSAGPLFRSLLFQTGPRSFLLGCVVHHIAGDGWSLGVFVQELKELYEAAVRKRPSRLPDLSVRYSDYSFWQREFLKSDGAKKQIQYWLSQLDRIPALILPKDAQSPRTNSSDGNVESFALSSEVSLALTELSQKAGVTLFMTLLAAFSALLGRYSNQTDFGIGVPLAVREFPETEGMIGFFVNTVVMRTDLSGNPSFSDLLKRVRKVVVEGLSHQSIPFDKLVELLNPHRTEDATPIFQVMFSLQNMSMPEIDLPGLRLRPKEIHNGGAKFDLTLLMSENHEGLQGSVEYHTGRFTRPTILRMISHFENFLKEVVTNSLLPIEVVPLLTQDEKKRWIVDYNQTFQPFPSENCVHELFEDQAMKHPAAKALIEREQSLSFQELNLKANTLAWYLHEKGIRPDSLIPVAVDRSFELVVAILGVFKAGGAYVPLDLKAPADRNELILRDTCGQILITQSAYRDHFRNFLGTVLCLDQFFGSNPLRETSPASGVRPDNLAYVIYTSGSTGRPKGVLIEHRSLLNYVFWSANAYSVQNGNGSPFHSSIAFDLCITSLFPLLISGKSVELIPEENEIENLAQTLKRRNAYSWVKLTPSHLQALEPFLSDENLSSSTQAWVVGGEALYAETLKFWRRLSPPVRIFNEYGPTEATVGCAIREVNELDPSMGPIPIGKPIANMSMYVLSRTLEPVPEGVIGEIYVGGIGVARGYLNLPDLTAERFISNPFSSLQKAKLYKTGDLGRYLPSGEIEYVGRADRQVKVRGFRVELGEIESAIASCPGIKEAFVLYSNAQVVAYFRSEEGFNKGLKNEFLRQRLPEYMIPSHRIQVDQFPLTKNGKIDVSKLSPPSLNSDAQTRFVLPRNEIELKLSLIWQEVLGKASIGVKDDFFEVGGHSLAAARVMSKVQSQFGIQLPLSIFFEYSTIERLGQAIRQKAIPNTAKPLVALQPLGTQKPLFCVHPAGGNVLCYFELSRILGNDQPLYGFQYPDREGTQGVIAVESLASQYIHFLREIQPEGPYRLVGWSFGGIVAFEMAQQLKQLGEKVETLALFDTSFQTIVLDHSELIAHLARQHGIFLDRNQLQNSDFEKQLHFLLENLKYSEVAPLDLDFEQVQQFFRIYELNQNAARSYEPRFYSGKVDYYQAQEWFPGVDPSSVERWSKVCEEIRLHSIPGDHQSMMLMPNISVIGQKLVQTLQGENR